MDRSVWALVISVFILLIGECNLSGVLWDFQCCILLCLFCFWVVVFLTKFADLISAKC